MGQAITDKETLEKKYKQYFNDSTIGNIRQAMEDVLNKASYTMSILPGREPRTQMDVCSEMRFQVLTNRLKDYVNFEYGDLFEETKK